MLDWNAKIWMAFVAIMGFVIGGTLTWSLGTWALHDATTLYNLLVAIFTGVLALSTIGLWTATRRSAERQLRAYISVRPSDAVIAMGQVPVVKCTVVNHGVTPAKEVTRLVGVVIADYPLPPSMPFNYIVMPSLLVSKAVLHPNQETHFSAVSGGLPLSGADFQAITTQSNRRLYVVGRVGYRDAFGQDRETKLCYSLVPSPAIAQGTGVPVSADFSPADRDNDWT